MTPELANTVSQATHLTPGTSNPPPSSVCPQRAGITTQHFCGCWGFELWSSGLLTNTFPTEPSLQLPESHLLTVPQYLPKPAVLETKLSAHNPWVDKQALSAASFPQNTAFLGGGALWEEHSRESSEDPTSSQHPPLSGRGWRPLLSTLLWNKGSPEGVLEC